MGDPAGMHRCVVEKNRMTVPKVLPQIKLIVEATFGTLA